PGVARPDAAHTSRNSLDWAGVYEGVLPCADCPGIKTRLTLEHDGGYLLETQYLDRDAVPRLVRGQFTWHTSGNAITLDAAGGTRQFAVGEGRLSQLDRAGAPIPSPHSVLTLVARSDAPRPAAGDPARALEAHRWRLESATDRDGRSIAAVAPAAGRAFTFSFSGARVLVEGGCNSMRGSYRIAADGRLEIGRLASTMKACEPALMAADASTTRGACRSERPAPGEPCTSLSRASRTPRANAACCA
ncbi:MAG: copper resistance protein NlpE N-terminal domain-containing protein, partial [Variibacter sp.]|nr:copper resistance protein NlpE N-terminal domain-containing protein [Variibacter sp.]